MFEDNDRTAGKRRDSGNGREITATHIIIRRKHIRRATVFHMRPVYTMHDEMVNLVDSSLGILADSRTIYRRI